MIDPNVSSALKHFVRTYGEEAKLSYAPFLEKLNTVFDDESSFLEKVDALDAAFDDQAAFEELREYAFDLLMLNFFAQDVQKLEEDYLESEEWEKIEEDTIDRGSELLNLLLYIRESEDADVTPSLSDYLKEFLLVDEDEFQDEHTIYEKVIANQILVDSPYTEVAKVARQLSGDDELKELFYPVISFFSDINPSPKAIEEYREAANNRALDMALYQLILHFYKP